MPYIKFILYYIHNLILYIIIPYILFIIIETLAIYEINYFQNMLIGILFNSFINKSNISKNKCHFYFMRVFFQYAALVPWILPKMREKHNDLGTPCTYYSQHTLFQVIFC